jgi:hypothetical protein
MRPLRTTTIAGVTIAPMKKYKIAFDAMIPTVQIAAACSLTPDRPS